MIGRATVKGLLAAAREEQARQIAQNSLSLVGSVALTAGLGFVYWFVAALTFPQDAIGLASASISAMTLLGSLAMFGLGTLLVIEIHRHRGREVGLIATAMLVAAIVGALLGVLFPFAAAALSREFHPLTDSPALVALFSAGVALTAGASVLDVALLGLLRGELQFSRSAAFAIVKLLLLAIASAVLVGSQPRVTIIGTWIAGLFVSIAVIGAYSAWKGSLGRVLPLQFEALRRLRGDALRNHALNLSATAPDWAMPVLVTAILSTTTGGAFFIAWTIAGVALFVPAALAQGLYAVCARAPETLPRNLRWTLRLSSAIGIVMSLTTAALGPIALGLLGPGYVQGAPSLVILAFGVFPVSIKAHYVTIGRLEDKLGATTRLIAAGAFVELCLAALGGLLGGLAGVSLGIVLGLTIQAVAMVPRLRRVLQEGVANPGSGPTAAQGNGFQREGG